MKFIHLITSEECDGNYLRWRGGGGTMRGVDKPSKNWKTNIVVGLYTDEAIPHTVNTD